MKKNKLLQLVFSIASTSVPGSMATPAVAQLTAPPAGQTIMSDVHRVYVDPAAGNFVVAAYVPQIEGLPGLLFGGAPSESSAYFTWVAGPTPGLPLTNGDTTALVISAGVTMNLYYSAQPNNTARTWSDPATFATGQLVATFQSTPAGRAASNSGASVVQSFILKSSQDFTFKGQTWNLRNLMPHGFTAHAFESNVPLPGAAYKSYVLVFTGAATDVAIGGELSGWPF